MQSSFKNRNNTLRNLGLLALLGLVMAGLAWWILITPNNPLTSLFRSEIADHDANVVVGPYPLEADFRNLKAAKVETIVTLLDPNLPYENTLLQREQEIAAKYGMKLYNFPLTSIFGKKMGDSYQKNAQAAADLIAKTPGKVYLHCYLGMHRVKEVEALLKKTNVDTAAYTVRQGERDVSAKLLDQAQQQYNAGQYSDALATLAEIKNKEQPAQMLEAWANYKAGNIAKAQGIFESLYTTDHNTDARTGLAYASLQQNELTKAESLFHEMLQANQGDLEALLGLGIVNFRKGERSQAAHYLKTLLQNDPNNQEAKDLLKKVSAK